MRAKEETEADEREDGANVGLIVAWLRNYDGDALSMFTSSVGGPDEAVAIIYCFPAENRTTNKIVYIYIVYYTQICM